jgi:hypothetical protein
LLESEIFLFKFDYDSWPGLHNNSKEIMRHYDGSLFKLRYAYKQVFSEPEFAISDQKAMRGERVFKISYTLNLLP